MSNNIIKHIRRHVGESYMTIKQKFKGRFIKALNDINNSKDTLNNNIIELDNTKQEYLDSYKKLLLNKLFYTDCCEIVFVRDVSISEKYEDYMPIIMCELLYADYVGFSYKAKIETKPLNKWYQNSDGIKTAVELKGNPTLERFAINVLHDSYYKKIKVK